MLPLATVKAPAKNTGPFAFCPARWYTYVPSASTGPVAAAIVIVAEADLLASVTEVAVTVTVFPLGTAAGAVYVVLAPLAVDALLNDPQAPLLPHVTLHFTPAFALSFPTFAVN
jgi:hypothetical protein